MEFRELNLIGVFEITLNPLMDERGFFMRTYDREIFRQMGIPTEWVQENHSRNRIKYTLRGLHFLMAPGTDAKLIRCIRGRLWDVFVDLRRESMTFGSWKAITLNGEDNKWLFLPKGFAHGYCTLEDNTEIIYRHDTPYSKDLDSGIVWNDSDLNISWPVDNPLISEKDKLLGTFRGFNNYYGGL
jgi:dTDP-4-dehydrorhamnose 3,5-epimerase